MSQQLTERSVVVELDGLQWATERSVVEAVLGRRPGVVAVSANPVAQTATVTYDPRRTTVDDLARWVRECGCHCRGESVPDHVCAPAAASAPAGHTPARESGRGEKDHDHDMGSMPTSPAAEAGSGHAHAGHPMAAMAGPMDRMGSPAEVMGHGGHGEMSMAGMVRDMRNRFLVAVVFGVVITLWSRIGRDVFGFTVPAPFGLRDDVFQLILSIPTQISAATRALQAVASGCWRNTCRGAFSRLRSSR